MNVQSVNIITMFKPGEKIVCVDAKPAVEGVMSHFKYWVEDRQTYTVRSTRNGFTGHMGVLLEELKNPPILIEQLGGKAEPGYAEWRFRRLEEVLEQISIKEKEETEIEI
jgi:hypothetical protein